MDLQVVTSEPTEAELARMEALAQRISALGLSLSKKRDEAINGRKATGIEEEWAAAEDAYQGIDDANRGDSAMVKPTSPNGGVTTSRTGRNATRSTVLPNITRAYVDNAAARVGDMLLPTDDTPWKLQPTPIATPTGFAPPAQAPQPATPQTPPGTPGMPPAPGQPPSAMTPVADASQQMMAKLQEDHDQSKKSAEGATKQIEDWHVECQWHAEVRKLIDDCARLGTGILKGPTPHKIKSRAARFTEAGLELVIEEKIAPESHSISVWNFYPDPGCGENIRNGAYTWEKDCITAKALKDLKGLPGYLDDQIDKVLEEGPGAKHKDATGYVSGKVAVKESDNFDIWYYHGVAERDDLEAAGVDGLPAEGDVSVHCVVTMVNDVVIKAALNPLDSGDFPYDVMPWQRRAGMVWGCGVAIQMETAQRMLTAATRNMMDNAGLSAGPQIIMRKGVITPADGRWEMTPRKFWWVNDGADVQAVNQAFLAVNIPTLQTELNNIIQFAMKMAEDVTGLPALMQGQNTNAPETVGGMILQNNNAGTVLRRIARLFDDCVTEPHIRRYYEYLMMYGEDDSIKGDFQIDARGSTALVERDLQNQSIVQMGQLVGNPAFGIDPEKWFAEMLKSQRLDPKRFQMDPEKKAALSQQPPPVAPQIEAAKIRAEASLRQTQVKAEADLTKEKIRSETDLQVADMDLGATVQKMRIDTDRDAVYVEAQTRRDQLSHEALMAQLEVKRELAMLEYANREKVSLDKVKADLTKKAMDINATKELAAMEAPADQLPKPPVEPPGLAPAGESFTK